MDTNSQNGQSVGVDIPSRSLQQQPQNSLYTANSLEAPWLAIQKEQPLHARVELLEPTTTTTATAACSAVSIYVVVHSAEIALREFCL